MKSALTITSEIARFYIFWQNMENCFLLLKFGGMKKKFGKESVS